MLLINKGVGPISTNIPPPDTVQLLFTIVLLIRTACSATVTKMNNSVSARDGSAFVRDIVGDYIINQYRGSIAAAPASNINCTMPQVMVKIIISDQRIRLLPQIHIAAPNELVFSVNSQNSIIGSPTYSDCSASSQH